MVEVHNFSAGPGVLPREVLEQVQSEFLDYSNTSSSIVELSHRSPQFLNCLSDAESNLRILLSIPLNYKVLFVQGGATMQNSAVVYNMVTSLDKPVDYLVTGTWTEKAAEEARRLGAKVNIVSSSASTKHNGIIPPLNCSPDADYIFYCSNETIHGVELDESIINEFPEGVPVICDMSSNFLSKPVDISKFAVIFGGAQKNIGPAGLTIVIVRDDMLQRFRANPIKGPMMLEYALMAKHQSMYNTPPTFPIYVSGLVFKWLLNLGGLKAIQKLNQAKASLVYQKLLERPDYFRLAVANESNRSKMNVTFRIIKDGEVSEERESKFLAEAESLGCVCLKGHRSVGGIRASLYNALPKESIDVLSKLLQSFV